MSEQVLQNLISNLPNEPAFDLTQWQPKLCGKIDILIKRNGEWWHAGQKIHRTRLIHLFSKLLWQEDHKFYLKTPVEKLEIAVEDAPFLIIQIEKQNNVIYAQTLQEQWVQIDAQHTIEMKDEKPYLHVRQGLLGLLTRSAFFQLIACGELQENEWGETLLNLQSHDFCWQLKA